MMNKKLFIIPNAHLDPVWLWKWQDGCNEVLQTFRSAVDRLNEYEELTFNCSSARYYKWVEEIDSELFEEIRKKVDEGRWNITGGWSVQPDCNLPSGESFARQALYNQLYYYHKFGKISGTGYCVDSFGHSENLPRILNNSGMFTYMFLRPGPHENSEIPEGPFYWKTDENTMVLAYHIYESYAESGRNNLKEKIDFLLKKAEEKEMPLALFFGVGNHGGGPTKGDIEFLLQEYNMQDKENSELKFGTTDEYFSMLCKSLPDLPSYSGELKHHASGCYSVASFVKQLNRKAENILYSAEVWDTLAAKLLNANAHTKEISDAWEQVNFNQFHDIMCGCSISEAYESVKASEGFAFSVGEKVENSALLKIARNINTWIDGISDSYSGEIRCYGMPEGYPRIVTVFNPLSFSVKVPVRTYYQSASVKNSENKTVPFANVRSSRSNDSHTDTVFLAELPPFGYETYFLENCDIDYHEMYSPVQSDGDITIENEYIKATFSSKTGFLTSLVSKESGREYAKKPLCVPVVIKDSESDTWAHNVFEFQDEKGIMSLCEIKLTEKNDVRSVVRITFKFGNSYLTEEFILANAQKTLRVKCKSNWLEKFTILKMSFDIDSPNCFITKETASSFSQYPATGEEENMQQWAAVTANDKNDIYGLGIVNDSKYSFSCKGSDFRITLLRNVIFADHYSDRPDGNFNFTDEGINYFEYGIYLFEGTPEKSDISKEARLFNIRPEVISQSSHKGELPQKNSFIRIDKSNVAVTALKFCEDGSGDIVIRLYETDGKSETDCILMSEILDCGFRFCICKNEIKTFRIGTDGKVRDVNFTEGIIPPQKMKEL